jgi:hypothetical protein
MSACQAGCRDYNAALQKNNFVHFSADLSKCVAPFCTLTNTIPKFRFAYKQEIQSKCY